METMMASDRVSLYTEPTGKISFVLLSKPGGLKSSRTRWIPLQLFFSDSELYLLL